MVQCVFAWRIYILSKMWYAYVLITLVGCFRLRCHCLIFVSTLDFNDGVVGAAKKDRCDRNQDTHATVNAIHLGTTWWLHEYISGNEDFGVSHRTTYHQRECLVDTIGCWRLRPSFTSNPGKYEVGI
jgi:hypothetical protein